MGKLNTTDETDIETVRTVVQDARHNVILVVRQRIYITNRTEMFLLYALRKVNNHKCKKG